MLTVNNLQLKKEHRMVFKDLNIVVKPGEILQIVGEKGIFKSTLLRIIIGLEAGARSQVYWRGVPLNLCLKEYYGNLTFIGQKFSLNLHLTVQENLNLILSFAVRPGHKSISEALEIIGLSGYASIRVNQLLPNEQRLISLARLVLLKTNLWVLDEPFDQVLESTDELLRNLFNQHLAQSGMIIFTTQSILHLPYAGQKKLQLPQVI